MNPLPESSVAGLKALFDFNPNALDQSSIQSTFDSIANLLQNKLVLVAGKDMFRIVEIEFYLYCG